MILPLAPSSSSLPFYCSGTQRLATAWTSWTATCTMAGDLDFCTTEIPSAAPLTSVPTTSSWSWTKKQRTAGKTRSFPAEGGCRRRQEVALRLIHIHRTRGWVNCGWRWPIMALPHALAATIYSRWALQRHWPRRACAGSIRE